MTTSLRLQPARKPERLRIHRRHPRRLLTLLFLIAAAAGSLDAFALPPLGRDAQGVIEAVDHRAQMLRVGRGKEARPLALAWNARTRFVEGTHFVSPAALEAGTPVRVTYRIPFFGKPFATKVTLPARRTPRPLSGNGP